MSTKSGGIDVILGTDLTQKGRMNAVKTALIANHKYKFEIITDTDLEIVSFNIYDVEDTNNETMIASAIAPINTLSDLEESTLFVNPLFMEINSTGSTSGPNRQCKFYLYEYTTEWLKVVQ